MGRAIHHLITDAQDLGSRICSAFDAATAAHLASAYLTRDGLARFERALADHLERGGRVFILIGLWDYITDPRALAALLKLQRAHPMLGRTGLAVRLASGFGFHWKLALFGSSTSHAVIVGSSNLTGKGASSVGELNLEIRGRRSLYEEVRQHFAQEFGRGTLLDDESLSAYSRTYKRYAALRQRVHALRKQGAARHPMSRRRAALSLLGISRCRAITIETEADDETLRKGVERFVRSELSVRRGWQWVFGFVSRELKEYRDGDAIVLRDRIARRVGIAEVLRTGKFMNQKDRQEGVVIYRWRRGGSRRFPTEVLMHKFVEKRVRGLGMSRATVGPKLMKRLMRALGVSG